MQHLHHQLTEILELLRYSEQVAFAAYILGVTLIGAWQLLKAHLK